jgi:Mg-chelatase subunit ChlD
MAERKEEPMLPLAVATSFQYSGYDAKTNAVTAMIELKAVDVYGLQEKKQTTAGYDIVLVLDVSGSMEEDDKLRMMLKTTDYLVRNLPIGNSLAVVTFSEYVKTIIPLTRIPEHDTLAKRQELTHTINQIKADGNTNICGALLEGLDVLADSKSPPLTQQMMILLTDGVATAGVKDAASIQSLMTKKLQQHKEKRPQSNVVLNAIGVGETRHLNRKLLENIATTSSGTFFLVQTSDRIASCLGDCMGSLMSMVAANIELSITIPSGVSLASCGVAPMEKTPTKMVWSFRDLLVGESRNILLSGRNVQVNKSFIDEFRLTYLDVVLGQTHSAVLPGVQVPEQAADFESPANPEVQVHMMKVMVIAAMEDMKLESLKMYKTLLQSAEAAVAQHPISIQLLADIEAALLKKPDVALRIQSLVRQRTCHMGDEDAAAATASPFMSQQRRDYQTQYTQSCVLEDQPDMGLSQLPPPPISDEELDALIGGVSPVPPTDLDGAAT